MSKLIKCCLLFTVYYIALTSQCTSANKYSAEANRAPKTNKNVKKVPAGVGEQFPVPTSIREFDKPYRMSKLNLLWIKAKHVSILKNILTGI